MVVDAVLMLDELLPLNMIGIKKVQGGSLEDSVLVIIFRIRTCFEKHVMKLIQTMFPLIQLF